MSTATCLGDIGVARVMADLLEKGQRVLTPVDSASPFDLATYDGNTITKIQVKSRKLTGGKIDVVLKRSAKENGRFVDRRYDVKDVDVVAVYCPDTRECYYVPYTGQSKICLRIEPTKNSQAKGVLWAHDYRGVAQ